MPRGAASSSSSTSSSTEGEADEEEEGEEDAPPDLIRSELCVGFITPWSEVLTEVRRWQNSQPHGPGHMIKDKAASGGRFKKYRCLYCTFAIAFSKRGEGEDAVGRCVSISERHDSTCRLRAASDTRKQDWGTNRVVRLPDLLHCTSALHPDDHLAQ